MTVDENLIIAINAFLAGDEEAFKVIYDHTYSYVYGRARMTMKNDEDAMELLQEVYIVVYKSLNTLTDVNNIYGWLRGVTYNQGMKMYRKKKDVLLDEDGEGLFDIQETSDITVLPGEELELQETVDVIKDVINELPESQRAVVLAYYYDELSVTDIAELLECSTGTIKSRLNYARKHIKESIEEKEKTMGIRLHSTSIPAIIMAIRYMENDYQMANITSCYPAICKKLGIGEAVKASVAAALTETQGATITKTIMGVSATKILIGIATIAGLSLVGVGGYEIYTHMQPEKDVVAVAEITTEEEMNSQTTETPTTQATTEEATTEEKLELTDAEKEDLTHLMKLSIGALERSDIEDQNEVDVDYSNPNAIGEFVAKTVSRYTYDPIPEQMKPKGLYDSPDPVYDGAISKDDFNQYVKAVFGYEGDVADSYNRRAREIEAIDENSLKMNIHWAEFVFVQTCEIQDIKHVSDDRFEAKADITIILDHVANAGYCFNNVPYTAYLTFEKFDSSPFGFKPCSLHIEATDESRVTFDERVKRKIEAYKRGQVLISGFYYDENHNKVSIGVNTELWYEAYAERGESFAYFDFYEGEEVSERAALFSENDNLFVVRKNGERLPLKFTVMGQFDIEFILYNEDGTEIGTYRVDEIFHPS